MAYANLRVPNGCENGWDGYNMSDVLTLEPSKLFFVAMCNHKKGKLMKNGHPALTRNNRQKGKNHKTLFSIF
jgi:hypothetical protein